MRAATQEPTGGNWAACWGGTLIHVHLLLPRINQITEGEVVMTVLKGRHQGGASQEGSAAIQGSFSKQSLSQLLAVSHEAGPFLPGHSPRKARSGPYSEQSRGVLGLVSAQVPALFHLDSLKWSVIRSPTS